MTVGLIRPALEVLEDQRVTTGELNWLTQECMVVITVAVMMVVFWNLIERGIEW